MSERDDRIEIEVDLSDEEFLRVAKMAHERDITFNDMVNLIMEEHIALRKQTEEMDNGTSNN